MLTPERIDEFEAGRLLVGMTCPCGGLVRWTGEQKTCSPPINVCRCQGCGQVAYLHAGDDANRMRLPGEKTYEEHMSEQSAMDAGVSHADS